jgi:hypothetical protein
LLERLGRRYRIIEPRKTSSLVLTRQEHVDERQDLRNLFPTLLGPSPRIPVAIKEGATSVSEDTLEEPKGRLSAQGRQTKVSAEEHEILGERL